MNRNARHGLEGAIAFFVVAGATISLAPSRVRAEEETPADATAEVRRYVGTYRYAESLEHGRRIVRKAMEQAIEQLSPIVRGVARRKLDASDPLVRSISIALAGDRVAVELVGQKTVRLSTKLGATEKVRNQEGKQVDLTQRFTKEGLVQVFIGPNGQSRAVYALQPDDRRLVVSTTMKGQQIETPISYRLEYVKQ